MRNRFPSWAGQRASTTICWTVVLMAAACSGKEEPAPTIGVGGDSASADTGAVADTAGGPDTSVGDSGDDTQGLDAADGSRQACLKHADCKQIGSLCQAGVCAKPQPCGSDKVCIGLGGVCAPSLGVCVECAAEADCGPDLSCLAYRCQPMPSPCKSSKDCTAFDKVCDKAKGICVACGAVEDCGAGELCLDGTCVLPVCQAADSGCIDAATLRACRSDGLGFVVTTCASGQVCATAACQTALCSPGSKRCEPSGGGVQVCDDAGVAWQAAKACGAGQACVDGACKAAACTPGSSSCLGEQLATCKADGSGWDQVPCASGTGCTADGAKASCAKHICTPGAKQCEGAKVQVCAGNGLAWSSADDCDQLGPQGEARVCVGGVCETATCTAGATSCGAGGMLLSCKAGAWEASSCGSGKTCLGGKCVTQSCQPGVKSCGGNVILVCNATGTDLEIDADCAKQGDACGPGVCKDGACKIAPKDCADGNPCTTDSCDGKIGCVYKALDGTICGEGKTCIAGACKDQVCKPATTTCQGQQVATCNASGTAWVPGQDCVAGGGKCGSGACKDGICVVQSAGCDDGNACTVDGCDAASGCTHKEVDGACDDGDACTTGDGCKGGTCQKGLTAAQCDDKNECTQDSCDSVKGCVNDAAKLEGQGCAAVPDGACKGGGCQLPCGPGYEAVDVDDGGVKKKACAALGPVWGVRPDKPVGVYTVKTIGSDKVVEDSQTKLVWQQSSAPEEKNWAYAKAYCDSLAYAGYKDWRLPSVHELATLVDYSIAYPGPTIDSSAFPGTKSVYSLGYCSASARAGSSWYAWTVHFDNGNVNDNSVSYTFEVRCVRGTPISVLASRYQVSPAGGVVTDTWTKLQWQRSVVAGKKDWKDAKDYCTGLVLEGKGWRLPWVRELSGLVDVQMANPGIDKTAFPNTPANYFWSASAWAGSSSYAYSVYFNYGYVSYYYVSNAVEVRCVRGS